jgi:hypothetical protein
LADDQVQTIGRIEDRLSKKVYWPRSWRQLGLFLLYFVVGPPAAFLALSPLLAIAGYATGWFAPGAVGNLVGLILLGAVVAVVFVAAALAFAAAILTAIGTAAATVGSAIAHIFSRFR